LDNEATIREIYGAFGRGEVESALALLADDIEWKVQGPPRLPGMVDTRGREEVRHWLGDISRLIEVAALHSVDFISARDHVVVYGLASHRACTTRLVETSHFLHWYTLQDGRVTRCHSFIDTLSYGSILFPEALAQGLPTGIPLQSAAEVPVTTRERFVELSDYSGSLPRGSAEDSEQLIRRWYAYLERGEIEKALRLLDEQVAFYHPGEPTLPYSGTLLTRTAAEERMRTPPAGLTLSYSQPFTLIVKDNSAVAFGERTATHAESGRTAQFEWASVFQLQAGLIRRVIHFTDTLAQADVLGIAYLHPPGRTEEAADADLGGMPEAGAELSIST
jgi:ketosteroid isomerase-like protein